MMVMAVPARTARVRGHGLGMSLQGIVGYSIAAWAWVLAGLLPGARVMMMMGMIHRVGIKNSADKKIKRDNLLQLSLFKQCLHAPLV